MMTRCCGVLKGKSAETTVEYSGEDIETTLSLVQKMFRDFGLEISRLEDEDTPGSYFEKLKAIFELVTLVDPTSIL
jgi:hypothetical protein